MTETYTGPETKLSDSDSDDRFSHYVDKAKIVEATVLGTPVTALCGKVWVPSRDPQKFPVCEQCKALLDTLRSFEE